MFLYSLFGLLFLYLILVKCGVVEKLSMPKGSTIKSSCEYEIIKNNSKEESDIDTRTKLTEASDEMNNNDENVPIPANTTPPLDFSRENKSLTIEQAEFNPDLNYKSKAYTGNDNYAAFCNYAKEKGVCNRNKDDPIKIAFDTKWCRDEKCPETNNWNHNKGYPTVYTQLLDDDNNPFTFDGRTNNLSEQDTVNKCIEMADNNGADSFLYRHGRGKIAGSWKDNYHNTCLFYETSNKDGEGYVSLDSGEHADTHRLYFKS